MYEGFYINLDRDTNKRSSLENNLKLAGLLDRYKRYEAIDGHQMLQHFHSSLSPGEIGCWLSHLELLHSCIGKNRHLHIVEDDAVLHKDIGNVFIDISQNLPTWDLLFSDFFISSDLCSFNVLHNAIRDYRKTGKVTVISLQTIPFAGTSSYFVNKHSIRKVFKHIATCCDENMPLDLKYRLLAHEGKLCAYAVIPFFSKISRNSASSIREHDLFRYAFDLYRESFYADAELEKLEADFRATLPTEIDTHQTIYLKLMQLLCGGHYKGI